MRTIPDFHVMAYHGRMENARIVPDIDIRGQNRIVRNINALAQSDVLAYGGSLVHKRNERTALGNYRFDALLANRRITYGDKKDVAVFRRETVQSANDSGISVVSVQRVRIVVYETGDAKSIAVSQYAGQSGENLSPESSCSDNIQILFFHSAFFRKMAVSISLSSFGNEYHLDLR
jgi:hypothetical protein